MAIPGNHKAPRQKAGRRRLPKVLLVLGLIGGGTYAGVTYFGHPSTVRPGVNDVTSADAQQQATLVDQEDQRIMQTNAVLTSTLQKGGAAAAEMRQPHNASSANGKTLLLPQRSAPYYVSDLERYGQQDFQKQSDGSYLLGVNVFVADGAKLVLQSATGPLTIRMRSVPGAFSSIVSFGGSIRINGSAQNPVRITSWNNQTGQPDTQVADGRAYIRSIGGEFQMKYAQISDLGFWSGRTGGIALTGTDRSDTSAQQYASWQPTTKRLLLPNGQVDTTGGGTDQVEVSVAGKAGGSAGFLVPTANLITGSIENSKIVGDAYGIFVSVSNQTQIIGNTIENSLVDGVLMHRFARNASIENTTVTGSRGDGFVLSRATESVRITGCTAANNGGNGFTLDGQPLAQGPTASGASTQAFGGSSVTSSTARNNGRYGVELLGGSNLAVQTSKITGGDMGIVVRNRATGVQISGNELTGQARQGIVLRDGVVSARVAGNVVSGTKTGIYLRDASGSITGNTVQAASRHGVSLMGSVAGSRITGNTFAGAGTSVLDAARSHGTVAFTNNDDMGWHNTAGFWTEVKRIAKPMNIVWAGVFLLVIVSAIRSRSSGLRIGRRSVHPYAQQVALAERPVYRLRRELAGPAGQVGPPDNTANGRYGSLGGNRRGGTR
jgi:parallel beta-helix repeat protein